jgi:hypothetical protein
MSVGAPESEITDHGFTSAGDMRVEVGWVFAALPPSNQ